MHGWEGVWAALVPGLNGFKLQVPVVVERVEARKGTGPVVLVAVPGVDGEFRSGQGYVFGSVVVFHGLLVLQDEADREVFPEGVLVLEGLLHDAHGVADGEVP